jgi:hypothetical protein
MTLQLHGEQENEKCKQKKVPEAFKGVCVCVCVCVCARVCVVRACVSVCVCGGGTCYFI